MAPKIGPQDRVLAVGQTRSGKSAFLGAQALLVAQAGGQVLEIDIKGDDDMFAGREWIGGPRQRVHYRPKAIKWDEHQVISYVPKDGGTDRDEMQELFEMCWAHPGLTILLHETIGPTGPNSWPPALNRLLVMGGSREIRIFAGAQRPVGFAPNLRDQADHIILFARRYSTTDLRNLATLMAFDSPEHLQRELYALNRRYEAELGPKMGRRAHIWWEQADGDVYRMPPIPKWMLP